MDEEFCRPTEAVVASLAQLFRHQKNLNIATIFESARAWINQTDYDNWNGGTYIFTLHLELPLKLFSQVEPDLSRIEKTIVQKLTTVVRDTGNHRLQHVVISPTLKVPTVVRAISNLNEEDNIRLWEPNCFRLFLSHVSAHKETMVNLKQQLLIYGVSAFVAHEDIEPTKEFIAEMELALHSAEALLAVLTSDFHASKWTDQEVGIALGLGLLVFSVRAGCDPYGFMGKNQALRGNLQKTDAMAQDIVSALLKHPLTSKRMHEALTVAFEHAPSFAIAKKLSNIIVTTRVFTRQQLERIQAVCTLNDQVKLSFGVPEKINGYLAQFGIDASSQHV